MTFHLNAILNWIFYGRHRDSPRLYPPEGRISVFLSEFTIFTLLKNPLYQPATFCQTIWSSSFLTVSFVVSSCRLSPLQLNQFFANSVEHNIIPVSYRYMTTACQNTTLKNNESEWTNEKYIFISELINQKNNFSPRLCIWKWTWNYQCWHFCVK